MALYPDSLYDFPNVSAYDSDLREVLAMLRGVTCKMKDFEVINKITNAGAWDITKQYKPWTIVSDNNIGYISVRPVPAGIEITNTDYWALVADYDILITNLSERISELENIVGDNSNGLVKAVNDLNSRNMNKYKNVICIADSWGGSGGWCEILNSMGFSSGTFQIEAHGGRGFQTNTPTFKDSILSLTPLVPADQVDCIIIIGGTNDQTDFSNLPVSIGDTVDAAITRFKNATVYVGFNIHYIVGLGQLTATEIDGSKAVVEHGGIALTGLSFNQRYCRLDWLPDNWHLSDYSFFAQMIYSGIYNGNIDIPRNMVEQDLGISNAVIRSAKANYHNGVCKLTISLNANQTFATLAHMISANTVPLLNLYGKYSKTIKSSTSGDTLDIIGELGIVDTFLGGSIGTYPITFTVTSRHGVVID